MFRGRTSPHSRFGLQNRGLTGTEIHRHQPHPRWGASLAPYAILCLKHPKGKNPHPARMGRSLITDPFSWTQKKVKWSASKAAFLARNRSPFPPLFNVILGHSADSSAGPSAERWQSG